MPPGNQDSYANGAVRFRQRVWLILCFGGAVYLSVIAVGMLGHVGAEADHIREYGYSFGQDSSVGACGMLFLALALAAVGVAIFRMPIDLMGGTGPGRYTLPYTVRPAQRRMCVVFAVPALAWFGPAFFDLKSRQSITLQAVSGDLADAALFAVCVALVSVGFAAWYLENRIEITAEGITYSTLFSRESVRFDEIQEWLIRNRRRSTKVQYVDIYRSGKRKPMRLQMDMHWHRSKEIVIDVLQKRAPNVRGTELTESSR